MKAMAASLRSRRLLIVLAVAGKDVMPSGESFVRQVLCGKDYFSHKLTVTDNGSRFDLRAFEIKSIKLRLGAHAAQTR